MIRPMTNVAASRTRPASPSPHIPTKQGRTSLWPCSRSKSRRACSANLRLVFIGLVARASLIASISLGRRNTRLIGNYPQNVTQTARLAIGVGKSVTSYRGLARNRLETRQSYVLRYTAGWRSVPHRMELSGHKIGHT